MADEASRIIKDLGGREGLVATFVGQHPQARAEQTLDHGVQRPQTSARRGVRDVLGRDEAVEKDKGDSETGNITGDVGETTQARALEAVLGNGIADIVDAEVGQLELVPVGIEHRAGGALDIVE